MIELKCANCGNPFYCYPSDAASGKKYCSLACRSADRFNRGVPALSRTPVDFTCQHCGKPFTMMQSYLTAYRKKFGRDPQYCSTGCSGDAYRERTEARKKFTCKNCGKEASNDRNPGGRIYEQQQYCDQKCKSEYQAKAAYERFKAGSYGRYVKANGYVWISVPSLANNGKKGQVMEHRYVMQNAIGRPLLREETVHHKDGNRQNNRIENLELFSSRHGPGQRVVDKIDFAIEILRLYPEFARAAGVTKFELHGESLSAPESQIASKPPPG